MVGTWFRSLVRSKDACGPLCREVEREIDSIGRADALARHVAKPDHPLTKSGQS